jgi:uncharacterized membrane protein YfcA
MLPLSFFIVAIFYSMVGFGGGSSYLALLSLYDVSYLVMPKIALVCNLLVVSGGAWNFYRQGHFNKKLLFPFAFSSVPFAFFGGMYQISEKFFFILLFLSLFLSGLKLLFVHDFKGEIQKPSLALSLVVGAILGLLSGIVGIGGGIFLAPIILTFKWGRPKEVAACCAFFIWINSLVGLSGQLIKDSSQDLQAYYPLFLSVLIGGFIGSRLGASSKISQGVIQKGTAVLIVMVSVRLLFKVMNLEK